MIIYHNPRCSKSRASLALLRNENIDLISIVEYLKNPPTSEQLKDILNMLGMQARQLMRTNEKVYKENNLDSPKLTEDELVAAMVKFPILIERPIVISNGKAVIGRPPERVLELLQN